MSTAAPAALITAEEFARMHFDQPVELVRGEIVYLYGEDGMTRPSQGHGWICFEIARLLGNWAESTRAGRITTNDGWITTSRDPATIRGADVAYFRMERLPEGKLPLSPGNIVPDLCVEVLSPHDRWQEVHEKIAEYLACGVQEVRIANPERRTIEVFFPEEAPTLYRETDTLSSRLLPSFSSPVAACFEGVS